MTTREFIEKRYVGGVNSNSNKIGFKKSTQI